MSLEASIAKRVQWLGAGPRRYLWFDCSACNREEGYALQEAFQREILAQDGVGLLILADFESAYHDSALTARWKDAYAEHDAKVAKIACLGVVGSMKIVFAAYRFFVRLRGVDVDQKMRLFDDKEQARAWLLDDPSF